MNRTAAAASIQAVSFSSAVRQHVVTVFLGHLIVKIVLFYILGSVSSEAAINGELKICPIVSSPQHSFNIF